MRKVHYTPSSEDSIIRDKPAFIYPIDHPDRDRVSNTKMVITSPVNRILPNGEFYTENTHYVPER